MNALREGFSPDIVARAKEEFETRGYAVVRSILSPEDVEPTFKGCRWLVNAFQIDN